jgi:hypothetical protein
MVMDAVDYLVLSKLRGEHLGGLRVNVLDRLNCGLKDHLFNQVVTVVDILWQIKDRFSHCKSRFHRQEFFLRWSRHNNFFYLLRGKIGTPVNVILDLGFRVQCNLIYLIEFGKCKYGAVDFFSRL